MKIAIAGSTGLIGKTLCPALLARGHEIIRLVRKETTLPPEGKAVLWDPSEGVLDVQVLADCDAVINLAGENIMGRWNRDKKQRLLESRLQPTRLLVEAVQALNTPPKIFINASATGFYGASEDEILCETSTPPSGFLAEICHQWEGALAPLINSPIRCVATRFGAVLSKDGGALQNMLPPFKLGLGGKLGSGTQHMCWIAIDDVIGGIFHILEHPECKGAFNFVAPQLVTNAEFTKILGKQLDRPTVLSMPEFMARLVFGDMADELLLANVSVQPKKLLSTGYHFLYPNLEAALRYLLA